MIFFPFFGMGISAKNFKPSIFRRISYDADAPYCIILYLFFFLTLVNYDITNNKKHYIDDTIADNSTCLTRISV